MNTELLTILINQGHKVAVKSYISTWKVFLFINWDWEFQWTEFVSKIEDYINYWISNVTFSKEEIEKDFTDEYKVVTTQPLILKVWDEVEILENVGEYARLLWRNSYSIECIWKKWKIVWIGIWDYEIQFDDLEIDSFPDRAVAKVLPNEENIITIWGKKYRIEEITE